MDGWLQRRKERRKGRKDRWIKEREEGSMEGMKEGITLQVEVTFSTRFFLV